MGRRIGGHQGVRLLQVAQVEAIMEGAVGATMGMAMDLAAMEVNKLAIRAVVKVANKLGTNKPEINKECNKPAVRSAVKVVNRLLETKPQPN